MTYWLSIWQTKLFFTSTSSCDYTRFKSELYKYCLNKVQSMYTVTA